MKVSLRFLILLFFFSCTTVQKEKNEEPTQQTNVVPCTYIDHYKNVGNTRVDTIRVGKRIVDPIDDLSGFEIAAHGFMTKNGKVYKKAVTHRRCNEKFIDVEYFQNVSHAIDLASYKKIDDTFFSTMNTVKFWWVNSGGHMIIPIDGKPDPETFKPFKNICGGKDKKGVYYGCPNFGVYKLNIPIKSNFQFIAKEDNYWNSPKHYVIINNKVYDVKYEVSKGYYCELNKKLSHEKIKKAS